MRLALPRTRSQMFLALLALATTQAAALATSETWSPTHSNLWDDYLNWSGGFVPDGNTDVSVSGSPVMASENAHNLTLSGHIDLTIDPILNAPKYMSVSNNATISGTLTLGLGSSYYALNTLNTGTIEATTIGSNIYASFSGNLTNNGTLNDHLAFYYAGNFTNNNTTSLSANSSFIGFYSIFNQNSGTLSLAAGSVMDLYGTFNFNGGTISGALPFYPDYSRPTTVGGAILIHGGTLNLNVSDGQDQTFNAVGHLDLNTNIPVHTFVEGFGQVDTPFALVAPAGFDIDGGLIIRTLGASSSSIYTGGQNAVTNNGFFVSTGDPGSILYLFSPFVNGNFVDVDNTLYFANNVANEADINVESTGHLEMLSARFNQDAGTLGNDSTTSFDIHGGGFNFNGGTVNLTLNLTDSFLSFAVQDGKGLHVNTYGSAFVHSSIPINTTIVFQPGSGQGSLISLFGDVSNSGNITVRLDNSTAGAIYFYDNPNNDPFTNIGSFSTAATNGAGSFLFTGNFANYGTVSLNTPTAFAGNLFNAGTFNIAPNLTINVSYANVTQNAGTLGSGSSSIISLLNGNFKYNGGRVFSTVYMTDSTLSTAVDNGLGTVFNAYGTTTLYGNFAPSTTLTINSTPIGPAYLQVEANAYNRGTIVLAADPAYGINLYIGDTSGIYNNLGTLNSFPATGSFASIYGSLRNPGNFFVNGYTLVNGDIDNSGILIIHSGATLEMAPNTFLYQSGTLEIDGTLSLGAGAKIVPSGRYTFDIHNHFTYNDSLTTGDGATVTANGPGAVININGDLSVGGHIVAQGGGNIVAQGGGNVVAQGGGNVLLNAGATGIVDNASSIVAQGAGNAVHHALLANALFPSTASVSNLTSSIIAQSGSSISLTGGNLVADNVVEIDAGATLSGHGNVTAALATSGGDISSSNGTLTFNAPLISTGGSLGGPDGLLLANNGLSITSATALHGTLQTSALLLAGSPGNWSSALDIRNAAFILQPADADKANALATLQDQLTAGQSHTTGVFTSTLAPGMTLLLLDNAIAGLATLRGAALTPDSIILVPASPGDATLDGHVDLNDLNSVLNHLGTATSLWTNGNFDGASTIDLNDLNSVLNNLGTSYATNNTVVYAESLLAAATPTPEPTTLLPLLAGTLLLTRRRTIARASRS